MSPDSTPVTATTRLGALVGERADGVLRFLGIPYARPPLGDLRWRAPQPPGPWEGPWEARRFGPACPQPPAQGPTYVSPERSERQDEDCLYLNLWTASADPSARRPVMVWLHGGGFRNGSGAEAWYDGAALALRGVVLVTLNYRLGALGFLAHEALEAESPLGTSGNYGLLDQVAALEWLRDHVAAFGGDPGNVTIFGQSAGAGSVRALLECPRARGLFHRAIQQSGGFASSALPGPGSLNSTYADKLRIGRLVQQRLGAHSLQEMRARPVSEVVAAGDARMRRSNPAMRWWPTADGRLLPRTVGQDVAEDTADVPLMLGHVANEANVLVASFGARPMMYAGMAPGVLGRAALELFREHPPWRPASAWRGLESLFTNMIFLEPAWEMARQLARLGRPPFLYHFTRVAPGRRDPRVLANHTTEIPYVFGNLAQLGGCDERDAALSEAMQSAWVAFARSGDPAVAGAADWPRFDPGRPVVMRFGDAVAPGPYPRGAVFEGLRRRRG
ncbi:MAG: carboxylesterase family protein [Steroidobacteraceae bacterium]|jgi:para-nitrobenzyl esterase|nr:carboxylesterase family protein [Steroidobacteraceae bacterium]